MVAQLVERWAEDPSVADSISARSTFTAGMQMAEANGL